MDFPALRSPQHGVTMLEVLIAIVVLSFGLLGMIGLLANGLKMTSSSHYRTIAAQQLTAIADMINANPEIVAKYAPPPTTGRDSSYCFSVSGCDTTVATTTTTTGTPPISSTTTTVTSALPATEYFLWQRDLSDKLPSGAGVVCLDSSPADGNSSNWECSNDGRPTVKICWNEYDRIAISGGGGSRAASSSTSQDTCLTSQL